MENKSQPIFVKLQNPLIQAALLLSVVLLFNIGALLFRSAGLEIETRFPWTLAASFVLFFSAMNTVVSIFAKNTEKYWSRSILGFVGLALGAALMAQVFSKLSMNEAGPYKWIFIVLTIGYLVFMTIMNAVRSIVNFAQREEWNQPRLRQKKRN